MKKSSIFGQREGGENSDFCDFILVTSLSVCAAADLKDYRIPNGSLAVGGGMAWAGLIWQAWRDAGWPAALAAAAWFLVRLVSAGLLGFPFFLLRMTGAGDVKMMSVVVAALGFGRGAASVGIGLCLGAVLALGKMLRHGSISRRFFYLCAYVRRVFQSRKPEAYYLSQRDGTECVIPLGACLWIGALIVILQRA